MKLRIEIDEKTLKGLIQDYLNDQLGALNVRMEDVVIQTKSKQNYKSEWESAAFRAILEVNK